MVIVRNEVKTFQTGLKMLIKGNKMTKETVKFLCFDDTTFTKEFMVKDIIETFIYNYNKGKTCLVEMCYAYQLLTVERI